MNLPVPLEFDFTKKLDGRNLVENEFTFVLKKDGVAIQTAKNSAPDATTGIAKIAFKPLEFTKANAGNTFTYTVEEVAGTDATVSYDNMVATIKVEVKHDGTTKATVVNMLQDAPDKEFNNTVKPPEEPKFNPEKYVVDKEKLISQATSSLMMTKNWQTSTQIQMRTHMRMMHQTMNQKT